MGIHWLLGGCYGEEGLGWYTGYRSALSVLEPILVTNPASFPGHNMGMRLPLLGGIHMYIHTTCKLGRDLYN